LISPGILLSKNYMGVIKNYYKASKKVFFDLAHCKYN